MEYIRAFKLLTREARAYLHNIVPLARETLQSSFTTAYLIARLIYAIARPLVALLINLYYILLPTFTFLLRTLWNTFCRQPPRVLAIEAGAALAITALLLLERRFRFFHRFYSFYAVTSSRVAGTYRKFLSEVRTKSKLAALSIPHMIFLVVVFGFHSTIGKSISSWIQGPTLLLYSCVRPAIRTIFLLYTVEIDEGRKADPTNPSTPPRPSSQEPGTRVSGDRALRNRRLGFGSDHKRGISGARRIEKPGASRRANAANEAENSNDSARPLLADSTRGESFNSVPNQDKAELKALRSWVVFGIAWGCRSLSWYFCPQLLEHFVTSFDILLFYFFVWAELELTKGAEVLYSIIARTSRSRLRKPRGEGVQKLNIFLRLLVAAGILKDDQTSDLFGFAAESGLTLLGTIFLITPRMLTFVGTVAIGLMMPAYLTIAVIEAGDPKGLYRYNWLSYWSVLSLIEAAYTAASNRLGWLPLWYHVKMCVVMWLQLPYFRGASTLLDRMMGQVGSTLSSVKRQVVTPRKRKRA
ncbi:Protein HVA22 [Gracilariopsis chorda]|uniref:Protein HVA22 n=1 Tax=Gracilariopsis chorda TaxID=448386 RepID=A0A2V3ITW0_9FLOR|nr:Protein HVA22 [Gracilariopsis chorda]|eukprot:PXF44550.1 Protein HVA22 [Gracilariopsis chorda]